jgi:putative phage-type endonuclease
MNQGSEAWLSARAGHVTASRFKDVLAKIKTGESASRRNYRLQLVTERLTGRPCDSYTNAAMEWGTATEPHARAAYETSRGLMVDETGFILHPAIAWVGCSPDGLIGADGGCEIKCPHQSTVHVETLECGMPTEHRAQVQGTLWVTGRKWWDFISFDPRLPDHLQLYIARIERDDAYIATLEDEVRKFLAEVEQMRWRIDMRRTLKDQLDASLRAVA